MSVAAAGSRARLPATLVLGFLIAALLTIAAIATTVGSAGIPLNRLAAAFGLAPSDAMAARDELVLWSIRLPRVALAIMIGAVLGAGQMVSVEDLGAIARHRLR